MGPAAQKLSMIEKQQQGNICFCTEITGTETTNPKTNLGLNPGEDVGVRDNIFMIFNQAY
jgi:hypothetical protein